MVYTFADLVAALEALPARVPGAYLDFDASPTDTTVRAWRSEVDGFTVLLMHPEGPRSLTHAPVPAAEAAEIVLAYAIAPPILAQAGVPADYIEYESWAWRHHDPVLIARWAAAGLWDAEIAGMAEYLGLAPTDLQPVLPPGHLDDQLRALNLSRALKEAQAHESESA